MRATTIILIVIAVLGLAALACGNVPVQPNTQATVQAFYETLTPGAGGVTTGGDDGSAPGGNPPPFDDPDDLINPTPTQPATLAPTPTPPNERSGIGESFSVRRCPATVTVDADPDEWSDANIARLTLDDVVFGENNHSGASDLSAEVGLCYTNAALYLAVSVTDDVHVQTQQGSTMWQGDEVEVVFDGQLYDDFYTAVANSDDVQIGLSPGDFADNPVDAVLYRPSIDDDTPITVAARRAVGSGGDYFLEAEIPWAVMRAAPSSGNRFGLCIAVSDNDQPGEAVQETMLSHCDRLETPKPTTWVTATFE